MIRNGYPSLREEPREEEKGPASGHHSSRSVVDVSGTGYIVVNPPIGSPRSTI